MFHSWTLKSPDGGQFDPPHFGFSKNVFLREAVKPEIDDISI